MITLQISQKTGISMLAGISIGGKGVSILKYKLNDHTLQISQKTGITFSQFGH